MNTDDFSKYIKSDDFKDLLESYEQALKDGESKFFDLYDLLDIAEYYRMQGDMDAVMRAACYCLDLYPDSIEPKVFIANSAIATGDVNYAQRIAGELVDEDMLQVIYLRAELLLIAEKSEEADALLEGYYERLEDDDEERMDMVVDVSVMYCSYSLWELAEKWIGKPEADELQDDGDYIEAKALIYTNTRRYDEAIPLWNKRLDDDAFCVPAWLSLSQCQNCIGECHEALQSAQYALAIEPELAEAYFALGNALFALGKSDEAIESIEKFLDSKPGDARGEFLLSVILFSMEKYDEANVHVENAIDAIEQHDACDIPTDFCIQLYTHAALVSVVCNHENQSRQHLNALLSYGYGEEEVMFLNAGFLIECGRVREAFDIFREVMSKEPLNHDACLSIGDILVDSQQFVTGHAILSATIKMMTVSGEVCVKSWDRLAFSSLVINEYDDFLMALEQSVKYLPADTVVLFSLLFPENMSVNDYVEYAKKHRIKFR